MILWEFLNSNDSKICEKISYRKYRKQTIIEIIITNVRLHFVSILTVHQVRLKYIHISGFKVPRKKRSLAFDVATNIKSRSLSNERIFSKFRCHYVLPEYWIMSICFLSLNAIQSRLKRLEKVFYLSTSTHENK